MLVDALSYGDDCVFDGGTGEPHTVLALADLTIQHTGSKAGVQHLPMRRGERPTKIVASGEGWDRLGWRPRFRVAQYLATLDSYRDWSGL
jgi:UDP-glucose 4-epimerase